MLATYDLDGQPADALDLKCLLIGAGMRYGLNPPGIAAGSHVSMCHDIYRHTENLAAPPSLCPRTVLDSMPTVKGENSDAG